MSAEDRKLFRRYLQSLLIWNPLITAAFALTFGSLSAFPGRWLVSLTVATVITQFCWGGIAVVESVENAIRGLLGKNSVLYGKVRTVALSILFMFIGMPFGFKAGGVVSGWIGREWSAPDWKDYKVGSLIGIAICFGFLLWESWRNSESRVKQLENDNLKAQLSALTNQMNPHFLFNALNTIASLIQSDPTRAEEMTVQFSDLYRGILGAGTSAVHPLSHELALCRAYLEIERTRMGERLQFEISVDPGIRADDMKVPALLLQPLVENAIKHGLSARSAGGVVRLSARAIADDLELHIEDDGVGLGNSKHTTGSGTTLKNCRSRLELLYAGRARFETSGITTGGTRVEVRIPAEMAGNA